jgi:hypothetical protein
MSEIGTKKIELNELDEIIQSNFSNPIAILERWFCEEEDKPDFFNHLSKLTGNASEWDKGRVFDDTSELKWERKNSKFHLVWMEDHENIPDGWSKEKANLDGSREILLWGNQINGKNEWYEKQIPRIFEYPIKNVAQVYVVLNEYLLGDGSKYYRFKEVISK